MQHNIPLVDVNPQWCSGNLLTVCILLVLRTCSWHLPFQSGHIESKEVQVQAETVLAMTALDHISMAHTLESKCKSHDPVSRWMVFAALTSLISQGTSDWTKETLQHFWILSSAWSIFWWNLSFNSIKYSVFFSVRVSQKEGWLTTFCACCRTVRRWWSVWRRWRPPRWRSRHWGTCCVTTPLSSRVSAATCVFVKTQTHTKNMQCYRLVVLVYWLRTSHDGVTPCFAFCRVCPNSQLEHTTTTSADCQLAQTFCAYVGVCICQRIQKTYLWR